MNTATIWVVAVLLVLGAAVGSSVDRFTPWIGANARIHHFKGERDQARKSLAEWRAYGHAEKAAFDESERLRGAERKTAEAALQQAQTECAARVARARKSALAIKGIITREPRYDANRCPVRELVSAGELRDALTPGDR